jgi:hypothetical protein
MASRNVVTGSATAGSASTARIATAAVWAPRHPVPGLEGELALATLPQGFNRRAYSPTSNQSAKRDPVRHRCGSGGEPSLGVLGRKKHTPVLGGRRNPGPVGGDPPHLGCPSPFRDTPSNYWRDARVDPLACRFARPPGSATTLFPGGCTIRSTSAAKRSKASRFSRR